MKSQVQCAGIPQETFDVTVKIANFKENKMFEKLVEIICNYVEVEPENVTADSRFMEDLGFTSFDFMSMLGELEDEFDVEIDQQEVTNVRTVGEAAAYLEKISE